MTKTEYARGENIYSKAYSYFTGTNYTLNNVQAITYEIKINLLQNETLKYDSLGNIIEILYNNGSKINYTYDNVGRLIREDNTILNKTIVFEYDNGGNIVSKKEYPYTLNELPQNATTTTLFTYDSTYKDKLVKVNDDIIGYGTTNNSLLPLSYKGATFTWNYNNRLTSYKKNANSNLVTYLYNTLGNRVQKSYNESTNIRAVHEYIYDGNTLIKETITRHVMRPDDLTPIPDSMLTPSIIQYLYDDNTIIGFVYNDTPYYYIKDVLGNIKYILDGTYNIVAKYEYDAWGNHVVYKKTTSGYTINQDAGFIGNVNPIRYKGYYYDVETQLYWVSSRYYSPELCRWISPDSIEYLDPQSINGLNLYAYCNNDPVNKYDPTGHFGIWAIIGIVGAAILLGGGAQLASNALAGETGSDLWRGVAGAALGSGVNALALCLSPFTGGASLAFAAGLGAAVQTGVDTLETVIRGETVNGWQTVADLGINFITTFAGNWIGSKLIPTNSGWFEPKKFLSVFMKPYGQKILLQTAIGAGLSGIVNFARKFDWSSVDWKKIVPVIPVPMVPIYPHF